MTGLMNRMVQRARGTLPAVEPLVRSEKAAVFTLSRPPAENIALAIPSPVIASEATHPPLEFLPFPAQVRAGDDPLPEAILRRTPIQTSAQAPLRSEHDSFDLQHPRNVTAQNGVNSNLPQRSEALPPLDLLIAESHAIKRDKTPVEPTGDLERNELAPPALELNTRKGDGLAQQRTPSIAPSPKEAPPVVPLDSAIEHTEIHITIGSIELRAPQVEAQRKPAAFKPRVALDDYLRRSSGAGS
jgi:hypothetical protein